MWIHTYKMLSSVTNKTHLSRKNFYWKNNKKTEKGEKCKLKKNKYFVTQAYILYIFFLIFFCRFHTLGNLWCLISFLHLTMHGEQGPLYFFITAQEWFYNGHVVLYKFAILHAFNFNIHCKHQYNVSVISSKKHQFTWWA